MLMDLPAWPWTAAWAQSPTPRRTCTACCPRASSLPSGSRIHTADRKKMRGRSGPRTLLILSLVLSATFVARSAPAQQLRVVATTSDLASLARAVAGDLAQVETVIPPAADAEAFEP